ncbi:DegV family protein [Mycoplasmopsis primatum]|uniref:DegV family protein n=1 Tax=Mycoplasmopsis primatum TaxID=55604 RepID=UPI000495AC37|nr:DegV family protein [Mycoplasmopsis primatum]
MNKKKLGFVFDSFTCQTAKFMEENNYGYCPFRTDIDGTVYEDGIDLTQKELIQKILGAQNPKSSLPRIDKMVDAIKAKSEECTDVLVFCISSCLSSTYNQALNISKEFPNVHVYDNSWGADQYFDVVEYIKKVYDDNDGNMKIVFEKLDQIKKQSLLFVLPPDVSYVINGGRVGSFKKFLLKTLKILGVKPYVKFYNETASTGGMGRSIKSAILQIQKKLFDFANINDVSKDASNYVFHFVHGVDEELNDLAVKLFKENGIEFKSSTYLSSGVAIHTGPKALCLSVMPDLSKWPTK